MMAETLSQHQNDTNSTFTLVGVVSSAGGLDAIKRLLSTMSDENTFVPVLVPHLDPTRNSRMVEILAKDCFIPVVEITQAMVPAANHIYVIPPGFLLEMREGRFTLTKPTQKDARKTSIDLFLQSLAEDRGNRSVGVVLSGTGHYGTAGIRKIKNSGGVAIVQDPKTAEFGDMPKSIIQEGLDDYIVAPEEIPATIECWIKERFHQNQLSQDTLQIDTHALNLILRFLHQKTGHNFQCYRKNMILRRVQRRIRLGNFPTATAYINFLEHQAEEASNLCRDLLINVTSFFRDKEFYNALSIEIRKNLVTSDPKKLPLRIWVPGCSTGEEAYSLAIVVSELIEERFAGHDLHVQKKAPIQLFASDVDESVIAYAREGAYPSTITADVSAKRLSQFFQRLSPDRYAVTKRLRELVIFSRHDLTNDPPFSKLDIVSCRNVLIYFEPEQQQHILKLFHFSLADNGLIILGPTESLGEASKHFIPVSRKWRIFRKLPSKQRSDFFFTTQEESNRPAPPNRTALTTSKPVAYRTVVEKSILANYTPATVLINRHFEWLYLTGPVQDFLKFPTGEIKQSIFEMCPPGLRSKLRKACQKCFANRVDIKFSTTVENESRLSRCNVTVRFVPPIGRSESLLIIHFHSDLDAQRRTNTKRRFFSTFLNSFLPDNARFGSVRPRQEMESSYVSGIEEELRENRTELIDLIRELESVNTDLSVANEEAMSVNEELLASNEEHETSKEELHTLNEELSTVNQELIDKLQELDQANTDMQNLISSSQIATVFLDKELNLVRFTAPTIKICELKLADVGKSWVELSILLHDEHLHYDCQKVLGGLKLAQREINASDSRVLLRRISPYLSQSKENLGVVLTYLDISKRISLEESLKESNLHALEIAAEEQQRIGIELHDGTQQELTGLNLMAGSLRDLLYRKKAKIDDHQTAVKLNEEELSHLIHGLERLVTGISECNKNVQLLSHGLLPVEINPDGLVDALSDLANSVSHNEEVTCYFVHQGDIKIDDSFVSTNLYRITQEAISNACKHSKASEIYILLKKEHEKLVLEIRDNGIFKARSGDDKNSQGRGLATMHYRARSIKAALTFKPGNQEQHTVVRCKII